MSPVTVQVELFYSSTWNDITAYCIRDPITITRGKPNEGSGRSDPAAVTLTLNNKDGRFSPRNPASPLFGLIGRNTPLRVTANSSVRVVGEVSSWPQKWTMGQNIWVPVEVAGVMRRLGQGQQPRAVSALSTFIQSTTYERSWSGTTSAETNGGPPLFLFGAPSVQFGAADMGPTETAGISMPTTNTVRDSNGYPTSGFLASFAVTQGGSSVIGIGYAFKAATLGPLSLLFLDYGYLAQTQYEMSLRADGVNNDILVRTRVNNGGVITVTTIGDSGPVAELSDGKIHTAEFVLATSGSDVVWEARIDNVARTSGTIVGGLLEGVEQIMFVYEPISGSSAVGVSYPTIWTDGNLPDLDAFAAAGLGHIGEAAGRRIERLCSENAIAFVGAGDLDDTTPMGPQSAAALLDLLTECADTDGGVLFETREAIGLTYRTRDDLYNQASQAELDYSAHVFWGAPEPVDDDQRTHNDVTVTNWTGGNARAIKTDGPLSVQSPPDGVNAYPGSATVNMETDGPLPLKAGWLLNLGTVDEARYPSLPIHLLRTEIDPTLLADLLAADITDRLTISNLPERVSYDDIAQLILGYAENITQVSWDVTFNAEPGSPYDPAVFASSSTSGAARFDAESSSTNATSTTTATSVAVKSAAGTVLWTRDSDAFPFDIIVAGERMTVTNITGSSSPQTFTVTRSVNGVVKSHVANEPVHLFSPARFALGD